MPRKKNKTPYVQKNPVVFRFSQDKAALEKKFDKAAKKKGATAVIIASLEKTLTD